MTTEYLCYSRTRQAWVEVAWDAGGPYDGSKSLWSFDEDDKYAAPYPKETAERIKRDNPALDIVFNTVTMEASRSCDSREDDDLGCGSRTPHSTASRAKLPIPGPRRPLPAL